MRTPVVDIITKIIPFGPGVREMLMVGTRLAQPRGSGQPKVPVTSEPRPARSCGDLTQMGYAPIRLLLGTSVYALGFAARPLSVLPVVRSRRDRRGSPGSSTTPARRTALDHIRLEAEELKADAVIGVKLFIHELGSGLVEVMAIGTAIRGHAAVSTATSQLIPQAIIRDRDTFFDQAPVVPGAPQPRSLDRS